MNMVGSEWEGDALIFEGVLEAEDVAEETRRAIGGDGPVVVDHFRVRRHRHMWCERNGFASIDSDGEWHDHFERISTGSDHTLAWIDGEVEP